MNAAELQLEHRALQQFLHLAPVGLVRATLTGQITMMNPKAAQLLAPLDFGEGDPNLFDILEPLTADVRLLVQQFKRPVGVVCDSYRVALPDPGTAAEAPLALGFTVLRLSADGDALMIVVTDQSMAVRLQRLQAGWGR